ncbi:hypothetical protein [Oceanimonas smirnovii]|uniref:hypothetical protein n=1 Tax=Oceanimonas smirnovii TaxID=264574 RepID=UPI001FE22CD5|nr:hypothetical protein [Oceanimonas smirnovii]
MNTSAKVDEQQREKAAREQAMIDELKEAPLVYEWNVTAPPPTAAIMIAVFSGCLFILAGIALAVDHQSFIPVLICTSIGLSLSGFVRYLWISDKHYHYQLTPIGIRYTIQDAIPETAYQVVRAFAWVGVFVCILAVGMLGPLAFVGAGGMAFLAFGMTNFSSKVREAHICFIDDFSVNTLKGSDMFSLENYPSENYQSGSIFCNPGEVDLVLDKIRSYTKVTKIKEVKSSRHLFS